MPVRLDFEERAKGGVIVVAGLTGGGVERRIAMPPGTDPAEGLAPLLRRWRSDMEFEVGAWPFEGQAPAGGAREVCLAGLLRCWPGAASDDAAQAPAGPGVPDELAAPVSAKAKAKARRGRRP